MSRYGGEGVAEVCFELCVMARILLTNPSLPAPSLPFPPHPSPPLPSHPIPHVREESDSWVTEEKLEAHTDWVRDVAWCPSVGLPISRIASCSQVMSVTIATDVGVNGASP